MKWLAAIFLNSIWKLGHWITLLDLIHPSDYYNLPSSYAKFKHCNGCIFINKVTFDLQKRVYITLLDIKTICILFDN